MIYVIKQFRKKDINELWSCGGSNAGYFLDFEEAKKRVENNSLDLCENGYYHYTAIMEFEEGLYNPATNEAWYEWKEDGYKPCDRPEELAHIAFCV